MKAQANGQAALSPSKQAVLEAARDAHEVGLCVIPPREDGSKAPQGSAWKPYQVERPSDKQLWAWFGRGRHGIGLITGRVSGGVAAEDGEVLGGTECFEFDDRGAYDRFLRAAADAGLADLVERIDTGYSEESPSGGIHWLYRCARIGGNTKLAERPTAEPGRRDVLIETRGEGGFVILAPSHGPVHPSGRPYRLLRGGFATIPVVTPEEREDLWSLARSFDEMPPEAVSAEKTARGKGRAQGGIRPGEDFEARADWADVLADWTPLYDRGEETYWRRPGKAEGHSATTNYRGSGLLKVFTTSTGFQTGPTYSKFGAYALLNHGGDHSAAARALADLGYGSRPSPNGKPETPPTPPAVEAPPEPAGDPSPNEAADDPHRLARLYRDGHCRHPDGLTLRYWRDEWWRWDGSAYRTSGDKEIRAELCDAIKAEFDRINVQALRCLEPGQNPPTVKKVTAQLVGNATLALVGYTLLKGGIEQPTWIGGEGPFPPSETLAARNALVHLPSFVEGRPCLEAPTPRFFAPTALGYDFDPEAPEPVNWLTFLGSRPVEPGGPVQLQLWPEDRQSIDSLQEWFGLNLVADTRYQKILALIGPRRSGKGTIARVLRALIGPDNVAGPTLSGLAGPFGLQPLLGKPTAIIDDARLSGRTDKAIITERLLSISGEGALSVDRKHRETVTVKLPTRFMIISNELPRLTDSSGALAGRLILLQFTRSFYGREDHGLEGKILPELPGILLWAIEGWKRLRDRGFFVQPDSGKDLVTDMEDIASPVGAFLRDRCTLGAGLQIQVSDLYAAWKAWCEEKGRQNVGTEQDFGRDLRAVLPHLKTLNRRVGEGRKRFYEGLDLAEIGGF